MADAPSSYPLAWPVGWPRARSRATAPFHRRDDSGKRPITMAGAREQLQHQLDLLHAQGVTLSTNVELNLNGMPRGDRARPVDVGVACYFRLKGRDTVLACDRWTRVEDNIVAIAKHIEALRGQERWGVGTLDQAFTGYARLAAPIAERHWTTVLELPDSASLEAIETAWKLRVRAAAGDELALRNINVARDQARAARSLT